MVDEAYPRPRRECRELVDHRRVDHLRQGAGHLHPGRSAADHDEVDRPVIRQAGVAVGFLEGLDDAGRQVLSVVERIEREGMLRPGRPEEVRLRAGGQDQVIAAEGLALSVVTLRAAGSMLATVSRLNSKWSYSAAILRSG